VTAKRAQMGIASTLIGNQPRMKCVADSTSSI
jgi:hypothetical protein